MSCFAAPRLKAVTTLWMSLAVSAVNGQSLTVTVAPPVVYGPPSVMPNAAPAAGGYIGWHGERYFDGTRYWTRDEWYARNADWFTPVDPRNSKQDPARPDNSSCRAANAATRDANRRNGTLDSFAAMPSC
jgi:hypothetical protein